MDSQSPTSHLPSGVPGAFGSAPKEKTDPPHRSGHVIREITVRFDERHLKW